jgi:hypothetical protein
MTWFFVGQFAFLFALVSAVAWLVYLARLNDHE